MACNKSDCRLDPEIAAIPVDISIERKEEELFSFEDKGEAQRFLEENLTLANYFLDASQYPSDSILATRLYNLMQQPSMDSLRQDTYRKFADLADIEAAFENAFRHYKHYYPQGNIPKIQTMITGLYRDLYVSDSLIIIGLEYFIGQDAKYKPNDVPAYIYRRFSPDYVVPASFLFLSEYFNRVDQEDQTLLNEMVTAGKSFYFTKAMMPCVPDSVVIGFTSEEISEVKKNEDIVWANFVQNQLLYEVNHMLKNKFMGERPNVYEIGEKCPGRVGAWVGWQIVNAYMEKNPSVTLPQLMMETDARKIFVRSKYKPRPS